VELENERVVRIHEKMSKPLSNLINAGLYHFDGNIFSFIKKRVVLHGANMRLLIP